MFTQKFFSKQPNVADYCIAFYQDKPVLKNSSCILTWEEIKADSHYFRAIGSWNAKPLFVVDLKTPPSSKELLIHEFRPCLDILEVEEFSAASYASQVINWHNHYRFCSSCGAKLIVHFHENCKECLHCKKTYYPRIHPCIITAIVREDEILLVNHKNRAKSYYTCVAGYMEPGESVEDAVRREILEETGITVGEVKYFASQFWPFSSSLMLGFISEYESGEIKIQESEIADAKWFTRDNLPALPPHNTISKWMIDHVIN